METLNIRELQDYYHPVYLFNITQNSPDWAYMNAFNGKDTFFTTCYQRWKCLT